ncbi:type II toxin-antitoxin system PemK/MazF family toxin [Ectobacillus polymachus]|uniref:type II toxin-antitoxin system PemK/MazF family toxin n=1 Tax=Ectobacillus polymachus TaxID=1508806 RepID=UPI003A83D7C5
MRYSEIIEKNIYTVHFDPVLQCEFNGQHLALVVKKNSDKKTIIVVPLTKSSNGDGDTKLNIGKIPTLPNNLKGTNSYAVYNQVRTVNASRVQSLKDDNRLPMNSPISNALFIKIVSFCSDELFNILTLEEKLEYHRERYIELTIETLANTSYDIIRLLKGNRNEEELSKLSLKIIGLYSSSIQMDERISQKDRDNGILEIINRCLDNSILDELNPVKK